MAAAEPFLPLTMLGNPVVRCAALAGACMMCMLVGMTIYVPLYFEVVLHFSAGQSGLALIPLVGATPLVSATLTGRMMARTMHYKRLPLAGLALATLALVALSIWPASNADRAGAHAVVGRRRRLGTVFPVSTVAMQNAVTQHQMGIATGAANFFRALFSSLVVAILGAIVLGGLGGVTGMSIDMLARAASRRSCPSPSVSSSSPARWCSASAWRSSSRWRSGRCADPGSSAEAPATPIAVE